MSQQSYKKSIAKILKIADVKINGKRAWDIQVHNPNFYKRVLTEGVLGLGESYMDGWWDSRALDQFFYRVIHADLWSQLKDSHHIWWQAVKARLTNRQTRARSRQVGEHHYDAGNDLYRMILDRRMIYTCGYWDQVSDLDQAQEAKLELICQKLGLKKGMKVLDIGCGWGGLLKYATEKYQIQGVGITISKEQAKLAKAECRGLPIQIRIQDYRDVKDKFDRAVSVGMFEHVGYKNYKEYMQVVDKILKPDGLFLLHTIGSNTSVKHTNAWCEKYIFPNSMLPSIQQIASSFEGVFVMEDWHSFGADYDRTLMSWYRNFRRSWSKLRDHYTERFYRMWTYYLLSSAGSFRAREIQLWQIVLSKKGILKGYKSIR